MKKLGLFSLLCIALWSITACTKVIEVNLNSVAPQVVIEGTLLEGTQDFTVRVTKTSDYFNPSAPTAVMNAVVQVRKNNGAAVSLTHQSNGVYKTVAYTATSEATYTLNVTIDGKTYEASSVMPKRVVLDSLNISILTGIERDNNLQADTFAINCNFQDPANIDNFYRIRTIKNGIPNNKGTDLLVVEDRLAQGKYINLSIFTSNFKLNDRVEVELLSIDRKMFDYFNTLVDLVGDTGNSSAAPANPLTNWSGGALGYFGAFSSSKKTIVVR